MQDSDAAHQLGHNNPPSTLDLLREKFAARIREVDALAGEATAAKALLGDTAVITDADQVGKLVELGIKAGKLSKALDAQKLETTKPLRDEVSDINSFFTTLMTRMDRVKTAFEEIVGAWNRKKQDEERRAAAERSRIAQEEARRRLEEAAAAEHSVVSEVVMKEAENAEKDAQKAAHLATKAGSGPTRMDEGTISSSTKYDFAVKDWEAIDLRQLRDCFSVPEIEKAIRAHVRKHKNTKPLTGVDIFPDTKTSFRG